MNTDNIKEGFIYFVTMMSTFYLMYGAIYLYFYYVKKEKIHRRNPFIFLILINVSILVANIVRKKIALL